MASITSIPWGESEGKPVELFTLTLENGFAAKITNYGGRIVSVLAPNRDSIFTDVVLGYGSLDGYKSDLHYMGGIVGRYCNRISGASFDLNGVTHKLSANTGANCLHGGHIGFDKKVMDAKAIEDPNGQEGSLAVEFSLISPDGDEGFPGDLNLSVTYTLNPPGELKIEYQASSDKDTVVNLTNHSYFNLAGDGSGDISHHLLEIYADSYLETDSDWIPTGTFLQVEGTMFDFRTPHAIGRRITAPQIDGYNHNYVLSTDSSTEPKLVAIAVEPSSGRKLETWTTEPGVQLYTLNSMPSPVHGKNGHIYNEFGAFCLETQHFPDSVSQPAFPTTVLRKGELFKSITMYKFSAV